MNHPAGALMRAVTWTTLTLATLLVACSSPLDPGPAVPGLDEPFTLAPGEETRIAGSSLIVGFTAVNADSRCPADVVCFWQGDAAVEVTTRTGTEVRTHVLHTSDHPAMGPRAVVVDGHRLEIVEVRPAPHTERPISPGDYRATLRLSRADP